MRDTDIVTTLRQRHAKVTRNDPRIRTPISGPSIFSQSADEIERLREQLRMANVDNFNTTAEVERLRAERDEARQRYCFAMAEHGEEVEARQNAKDEGWDCFKEEKP